MNSYEKGEYLTLPDIKLCNKCKPFGYCLSLADEEDISVTKNSYSLKDFVRMIPLRAGGLLQKAFDAFHQDDYETAILLFRVIDENTKSTEVNLYLAISYLLLEDFENASRFMIYYEEKMYKVDRYIVSNFFDLICIRSMNKQPAPLFAQKSATPASLCFEKSSI